MCQFFAAISNGKGKTLFFKLEDIVNQMVLGNPKNYEWNSHTSIAHFNGIKGADEDKWNKWEYDVNKKEIKADSLVTKDDSKEVKVEIEKYLKGKNILYLQNLYNMNSGDMNSGDMNSGDMNSGNMNSGNRNSGYRNSGDMNSGNWNSGNWNSGSMNSGNRNSGNGNSGNGNSGNGNSGYMNSGCIIGHFSSKKLFFLFNKPCTEEEAKKVYDLELWKRFNLTEWVEESNMTNEEKEKNPSYKITGGYLKVRTYKEAWALVPKEVIEKINKLKNFDAKVFEEITGLVV